MKRTLVTLALGLCAAACGGKSSTAPTAPTPPPTPTRIISVAGTMTFGEVNFGSFADRTLTVSNTGNATLTFTSLTCSGGTGSAGFTANPTTGTIAAGASQNINVRFTPTIAQFYSCVLSVVGDQTGGNNAINISGVGVNNTPLFTRSGTGDTVFDMPRTVARIRITGHYAGNSSNFIVHIGGNHIVNELLGTFWGQVDFTGTYLTSGGVVEILSSSGVQWTFTEVR
jgi:hypothetical protein